VPGKHYDIAESSSESVRMLSSAAKEVKRWLIGGVVHRMVIEMG
jgi:omega-amidase